MDDVIFWGWHYGNAMVQNREIRSRPNVESRVRKGEDDFFKHLLGSAEIGTPGKDGTMANARRDRKVVMGDKQKLKGA